MPMDNIIINIENLDLVKAEQNLSFVYFKNDSCSVCGSLYPQLLSLISSWDERLFVVNCAKYPEIAAQNMILTVPSLKVYFGGHEVISMLRFIDLRQLEHDYKRLKTIL
jgi:thioredoxin-like negative regulator of GroEL